MAAWEFSRSTRVDARPERVHVLVNDFGEWTLWSPWEDLDPELERSYSGPTSGVGARYAWRGNRKAGQGEMQVLSSTPERIVVRVSFDRPFRSTSESRFDLHPAGEATDVVWTMSGETTGLAALFSRFLSMDKLLGKDIEKGLARLRAAAEQP